MNVVGNIRTNKAPFTTTRKRGNRVYLCSDTYFRLSFLSDRDGELKITTAGIGAVSLKLKKGKTAFYPVPKGAEEASPMSIQTLIHPKDVSVRIAFEFIPSDESEEREFSSIKLIYAPNDFEPDPGKMQEIFSFELSPHFIRGIATRMGTIISSWIKDQTSMTHLWERKLTLAERQRVENDLIVHRWASSNH